MDDTVTTKEAAFMLDTSFDDDIKAMQQEYTLMVAKYINSTPELYNRVKNNKSNAHVSAECQSWAESHGDEFGELFITELNEVDWAEVCKRI